MDLIFCHLNFMSSPSGAEEVFSHQTKTEETLPRSEGFAVQLQTCLWSEVSGEVGFFLVRCYKDLKTRNVENFFFFFYPQCHMSFELNKDNNVWPSHHCGFKQAVFWKYVFLVSVLQNSLGCISLGRFSVKKYQVKHISTTTPSERAWAGRRGWR